MITPPKVFPCHSEWLLTDTSALTGLVPGHGREENQDAHICGPSQHIQDHGTFNRIRNAAKININQIFVWIIAASSRYPWTNHLIYKLSQQGKEVQWNKNSKVRGNIFTNTFFRSLNINLLFSAMLDLLTGWFYTEISSDRSSRIAIIMKLKRIPKFKDKHKLTLKIIKAGSFHQLEFYSTSTVILLRQVLTL
jgi:hypothetical protein